MKTINLVDFLKEYYQCTKVTFITDDF